MEFEDFKRNYSRVEICNMTPDSLTDSTQRHWEVNMLEGSWIRGSTAGGCRNYIGESDLICLYTQTPKNFKPPNENRHLNPSDVQTPSGPTRSSS